MPGKLPFPAGASIKVIKAMLRRPCAKRQKKSALQARRSARLAFWAIRDNFELYRDARGGYFER